MVIRVDKPEEFPQTLQKALEGKQHVFVYFFGTEIPAIDASWCQDCVVSDPWIRSAAYGHELLEVPVGDREHWKLDLQGADNYYRTNYKLDMIPTIVKFNAKSEEVARLEDPDTTDMQKLQIFFTSP
jgi:hypothetical protein